MSALALAVGLCTTTAIGAGCGRSSGVIDGELSENARKTVFEKRVDVKNKTSALQPSKTPGAPGRDRRP